jgi:integrase/recombinase XerD
VNRFQERMRDELVRRNYAESTIRSYLRIVRQFQQYCGKGLDCLGPDDLRGYHTHLLEERKLAVRTVVQHVAAIRRARNKISSLISLARSQTERENTV